VKIAGIDPGRSGAIVVLDMESRKAWDHSFSYDGEKVLDGLALLAFLLKTKPDVLLMEKVIGRGGWNATTNFSLGSSFGQIAQVVRLFRSSHESIFRLVEPKKWTTLLHEGLDKKLEAKERSLLAYAQLFPHAPLKVGPRSGKIDHNVLDALLIAVYGVMKFGKGSMQRWTFEKEVEPCEVSLNLSTKK